MKIACPCGSMVVDQTDGLPTKARFIPDEAWFGVLDAIDAAIEETEASRRAREEACHRVRRLLSSVTRTAWQCRACGRLFVDDARHELRAFVPEPFGEHEEVAHDVLRASAPAE